MVLDSNYHACRVLEHGDCCFPNQSRLDGILGGRADVPDPLGAAVSSKGYAQLQQEYRLL